MRETDSGVAGCAFDDCTAWFEEPAFFGVFYDVEGCAVFDATAGVHELGFAEDFAACGVGDVVETDEGGVADSYESVSVYSLFC